MAALINKKKKDGRSQSSAFEFSDGKDIEAKLQKAIDKLLLRKNRKKNQDNKKNMKGKGSRTGKEQRPISLPMSSITFEPYADDDQLPSPSNKQQLSRVPKMWSGDSAEEQEEGSVFRPSAMDLSSWRPPFRKSALVGEGGDVNGWSPLGEPIHPAYF